MGEAGEFLLRCEQCSTSRQTTAFYPLTLEFWLPSQGLQRCRACHQTNRRIHHKLTLEQRRARNRRYYQNKRERRLTYARTYLEANREHINTKRRERYAEKRMDK